MDEQDRDDINLEYVPDDGEFDGSPPAGHPAAVESEAAPAAPASSVPAAETAPEFPESMYRTGEDPVAAVVRLTAEHAAAAQNGSPDQPWLLMARKAASNAIHNGEHSMVARLARENPAHLAVVQADVDEIDTRALTAERVTELLFDKAKPAPNQFANPSEIYLRAKERFAFQSSRAQSNYEAAAQLDYVAKRYASGLVRSGRLIDIAYRDENLALTALGDAGIAKHLTTSAAVDGRLDLARAYLNADAKIHNALNANNWTAYGDARDERIVAMRAIAKDPVAIVALGRLANERQVDIRSRAAADFELVRTETDREHAKTFDRHLKEFEGSFLKDLTIKGSDPMHRWIQIQNEIERQERGAQPNGPNLAYLKKLSEKTALEAATRKQDWGRLAQSRPDLLDKFVRDADAAKESLRTLNKESTVQVKSNGDVAVNEAAAARNAGESPELAAAKAGPAPQDRKAAELRAHKPEQVAAAGAKAGVNPTPGLRADPVDRIMTSASKAQQTNHSAAQPANNQTGAPAGAHRPRNAKQAAAMQHTNTKNPEFDQDTGAWESKPNRDLGSYVNARTPYDMKSLQGQLHDPRKLVLAFPLNSFASDRVWKIKKELRDIAKAEPERFKAMYQATKDTWISWQNAPGERNMVALDQLELGRRVLAEVGVRAGLVQLEKAVKHARPLKSNTAKPIDAKAKFDPHNFIQKGTVGKLGTYYMAMATDAVHQKAKDYHASTWRKLKVNIAGDGAKYMENVTFAQAATMGAKRAVKSMKDYITQEMTELAR